MPTNEQTSTVELTLRELRQILRALKVQFIQSRKIEPSPSDVA
jgi:hypothetical protein